MYVRGCVVGAGRQMIVRVPASKRRDVRQTTVVPPLPALTMFVATTASRTTAERVNVK